MLSLYRARQAVYAARKIAVETGTPTQVHGLTQATDWLDFAARDGKDLDALPGGKHPFSDLDYMERTRSNL